MKIPRWLSITLILLLLIVTVVTLFYTITDWRGAKEWQAAKTELLDRGEPLSFDQLREEPIYRNLPPAPTLLAGLLENNQATTLKEALPPASDFPSPENDPSAAEWTAALDQLNPALQRVAPYLEATDGPMAWPYDLSDPVNTALPQITLLNRIAQLLQIRAEAGLALKRPTLAKESLETLMRLRQWTAYPLTLIEALVGFSLDRQILDIIRNGLIDGTWSADDLAEFEKMVGQLAPIQLLERGLRGERVFFLTVTEDLSKEELASLLAVAVGGSMSESQFSRAVSAIALYPKGWLDADRADYAVEFQVVLDRLRLITQGEVGMESATPLATRGNDRHPLTQLVRATIDSVINRGVTLEALRRQTLIALALEQHRLESGRYPSSLSSLDLPPTAPLDPARGETIEYVADEDGYRLSVPKSEFYREQDLEQLQWDRKLE